MAIREILKMGHPTLLEVAKPVEKFNTSELDSIIEDMIDTMKENDGAGLAAPQIGLGMQLVIFGFDSNERYPEADQVPFTVLINPVITPIGDEEEDGWEGCLSVPGLMGVVPRFKKIRYQGKDQHGNEIDREVDGFHARVVQHECDHLIGKLYPMRIRDFSQFGYLDTLTKE
ncbi:peptide deformylase [Methylophilaceae bacterium]|jgi:peptide deformylase|nr:peptide deformylase [Methylophilaceae bacterium]MDC1011230.1 peptide deformylase [Methylophilaceae bacterium]